MTITIEPTADEVKMFEVISKAEQPVSLRNAVLLGEGAGLGKLVTRRALWALIDRHQLILHPDNAVSVNPRTKEADHE